MSGGVRALATGAALFLVGCVTTGAGLELSVRLLAPQTLTRDEGLYVADAGRSFKLSPGFRGAEVSHEFSVPIVVNRRGLREREIEPGRRPGVTRVLVLGDSFTYGSGVAAEETYPRQLEDWLTARGGRFEVVNAGVSGYGTVHEAAFLRAEGWAYEPDVLVLQVFLNNDLSENLYPNNREVRGGFLRFRAERPGPAWLERVKEAVRRHSHAWRLLGDRYHQLRIRLGWEPFYAASLGVYERRPAPDTERGWAVTRDALHDVAAMARARRVPLLVVHTPKSVVLDSRLQAAFAAFHRADPATLDWDLPARRLGELVSAEGAAYLDLVPLFRAVRGPLDLYHRHNGHWNAGGHAAVAGWIGERLAAEGWLGAQPASAAR